MYRIDFIAPSWEYSRKGMMRVETAKREIDKIKSAIAEKMDISENDIEVSDYLVYEDRDGFKYFDCVMQADYYYAIQVHCYYENNRSPF